MLLISYIIFVVQSISPAGLSGLYFPRACLKIAFRQLCVPLCGRFGPDEGGVAGYVDRIGTKYTAKWGVQMAGMNFQTGPSRKAAPDLDRSSLCCMDICVLEHSQGFGQEK